MYVSGFIRSNWMGLMEIVHNLFRRFTRTGYCEIDDRMDGQIVLITGCNSGLGKGTAIELAKRGATILMACRNEQKAMEAAVEIMEESSSDKVRVYHVDLSSLASISKFVEIIKTDEKRIDILINNASTATLSKADTEDGFDIVFGTNYLGPFYLTLMLIESFGNFGPRKVIGISSQAHHFGLTDFENPKTVEGRVLYSYIGRYSQSKLAIILFARELAKRVPAVNVYTVDPGLIRTDMYTAIYEHTGIVGALYRYVVHPLTWILFRNVSEGIQTVIYCAVESSPETKSGLYYKDCEIVSPDPVAENDEIAVRLWNMTCDLVGLPNHKTWNLDTELRSPVREE